ncbi:hypothetical protein [Bacillus sp. Marseille-P3800]|uniref:hypothetical protein n=1 Tax=Bacillus sp. Marseille-P3800 TaxID=2014782 RepID=UPI000C069FA5|nr:hypothetical protein [Bacillus sp. Marseille-P3800]
MLKQKRNKEVRTMFTKFVEFKRNPLTKWYGILEQKGVSSVVTYTCKFRREALEHFNQLAKNQGAVLSYVRKLR